MLPGSSVYIWYEVVNPDIQFQLVWSGFLYDPKGGLCQRK